MKLLRQIREWIDLWRCRWQFRRLAPEFQRTLTFLGMDPDSIFRRRREER